MKDLYIWGWWQGYNLGDNWIKEVLSCEFPYAKFVDTSIQRFPKGSFVICGGGGLFIYDVIAPWDSVSNQMTYGVLGIGAEFTHDSNKAQLLAKNARFFFARDKYSVECMKLSEKERSYDLTFLHPLEMTDSELNLFKKVFFVWRDGKELIKDKLFENYVSRGSSLTEWRKVLNKFFDVVQEDDFQTEESNIGERISDADFVVSGRYHGIVAAIQKGIPFIAIDICPKIRALTIECGLEDYCIKVSEINKVEMLINRAKSEIVSIREKEAIYTKRANTALRNHIRVAKFEILKVLHPLNIIHYGSYWMRDNDVVNVMAGDLARMCNARVIDLKAYSSKVDKRIKSMKPTPNGCTCLLDEKRVIRDIRRFKADAIILNSGGLHLEDSTYEKLANRGVISIGISLSDPDVFPYNGKEYASNFDVFYTNSKYSLENDYDKSAVNIKLLPFAASIYHHYYMKNVERQFDLVVVAHAREDRIGIVDKLEKVCKVGLYGSGWNHSLGEVNGKEHVAAINSGRMYLSFAKTLAGYENVKVGLFEAMACNQVVITSYMKELEDYFEIGKEVLCYKNEEELIDIVKYYSTHDKELEDIRANAYKRFLSDHSYQKRWDNVLKDIYVKKGLIDERGEVN